MQTMFRRGVVLGIALAIFLAGCVKDPPPPIEEHSVSYYGELETFRPVLFI